MKASDASANTASQQKLLGHRDRASPGDAAGPDDAGLLAAQQGRPATEILEVLRAAARSHDAQRFWLAAATLGPLEADQAARVAEMLREDEKDPKASALYLGEFVRYGGAEGLTAIARHLMEDRVDPRLRDTAVDALGEISPERREEAIPILVDLLKSGLPFDETAGARTLGRLLGPGAVAGLIEVFDAWAVKPDGAAPGEKEVGHELNVLSAMEEFATAEDRDVLTGLFDRRVAREVQVLLCRILAAKAGAEGTQILLGLLSQPPEGAIRDVIAESLEKVAQTEHIPLLWEALEREKEARVQSLLASLIANLAGPEELKRLVARALDPSSGLAPDALLRALRKTKDREVAPLLLELVPQVRGEYAVVNLAKSILRLMGREEGTEKLLSLAAEGQSYTMVSELTRALIEDDPEHAPRRLVALMERVGDGVSRTAIADVLGKERSPEHAAKTNAEIIPALTRLLSAEKDPTAQEHIASAIASCGPEGRRSLDELLLGDEDPRRRFQVLRSLGFLPTRDTASLARRVLHEDPSADLRCAAAKILGRGGDAALLDELSSALSTETDPEVRGTIQEIVNRGGTR